jgi:hypothetical protein
MMKKHTLLLSLLLLALSLALAACGQSTGTIASATTPDITPTPQGTMEAINKNFQTLKTPVPGVPAYRCGAWSSNNAPGMDSTITIYARLTHNLQGVAGEPATAVVHFADGDAPMDMTPVSDNGGYVTFTFSLGGRQPHMVPATVDVTFTVQGKQVPCSQAFFTP